MHMRWDGIVQILSTCRTIHACRVALFPMDTCMIQKSSGFVLRIHLAYAAVCFSAVMGRVNSEVCTVLRRACQRCVDLLANGRGVLIPDSRLDYLVSGHC